MNDINVLSEELISNDEYMNRMNRCRCCESMYVMGLMKYHENTLEWTTYNMENWNEYHEITTD